MKHSYQQQKSIYCELIGIDVSYFTEEVRALMEDEMKTKIRDKVLAIHPYSMPAQDDYLQKGRCKTYINDPTNRYGRKAVYATSYDEMILKLHDHYFGVIRLTFEDVFFKMIEHHREFHVSKDATLDDHESEYNRFFKGDNFVKNPMQEITVADMARFLDRAHLKVSSKDMEKGQKVIEKHRHNSIRTIINLSYGYANQYLSLNLTNPIASLNYAAFPYYDADKIGEKPWYSEEDRLALLEAWDSIENPDSGDLCAGFLLETAGRNGECRAFRFQDFHFDADIPYVRICGMARDGHRDEEIKANSYAGKRNLPLTERLEKIYNLAKELSWSDTYMFVRSQDYVRDEEILIPYCKLYRSLKKLCKRAGVMYLPPHQIRFSDATLMAMQDKDVSCIQHRLGHTGPTMAEHYIRRYELSKPAAGPNLTQRDSKEKRPKP